MKRGHLVSLPVAGFLALLSIIGTQGMSGRESSLAVFAGFAAYWFVIYGVAGCIPYAEPSRNASAVMLGFLCYGVGGAAGGLLVAGLLMTHHLGGSAAAVLVDFTIPFTVPPAVGVVVQVVVALARDDRRENGPG
jgi:hypothetical protein